MFLALLSTQSGTGTLGDLGLLSSSNDLSPVYQAFTKTHFLLRTFLRVSLSFATKANCALLFNIDRMLVPAARLPVEEDPDYVIHHALTSRNITPTGQTTPHLDLYAKDIPNDFDLESDSNC